MDRYDFCKDCCNNRRASCESGGTANGSVVGDAVVSVAVEELISDKVKNHVEKYNNKSRLSEILSKEIKI